MIDRFGYFSVLFLIYFPMALGPYYSFGGDCTSNIVLSISTGYVRLVVEIMLLLHLITAFPILTNPPAQFLEFALNIPEGKMKSAASRKLVSLILFLQILDGNGSYFAPLPSSSCYSSPSLFLVSAASWT